MGESASAEGLPERDALVEDVVHRDGQLAVHHLPLDDGGKEVLVLVHAVAAAANDVRPWAELSVVVIEYDGVGGPQRSFTSM